MTRKLLMVTFLLLAVSGCNGRDDQYSFNQAKKYGLNESTKYSERIENAIFYVNSILGGSIKMRLVPTWKTSIMTSRYAFESSKANSSYVSFSYKSSDDSSQVGFSKDILTFYNAEPIPVYLIDDDKLGSFENVFVPDGERCIFVNVNSIDDMYSKFGLTRLIVANGGSIRQQTMAISLIFLHELGHIYYGDAGSYTAPTMVTTKDIDMNSVATQNKETRADKFAIEQILEARRAMKEYTLPNALRGIPVDSIIGDMYRTILQAVSDHELKIDPFGIFDKISKPLVFASRGYSHPNIFLRFYIMDIMLEPNSYKIQLLKKLGVIADASVVQ